MELTVYKDWPFVCRSGEPDPFNERTTAEGAKHAEDVGRELGRFLWYNTAHGTVKALQKELSRLTANRAIT